MRNWKFLLTSQIVRGYWFMNLDHADSGMSDVQMLLNPNQQLDNITHDILSATTPLPFLAASQNDEYSESSYDNLPENSIAVFNVAGTMLKNGTMCSYGTEEIGYQMQLAAANKNIVGCLFEGDSGGGAVNSVSPIREGFRSFKSRNKPTLALVDAAYSAMYFGISLADRIVLSNLISAGTGSIGVMLSYTDMQAYYKKMGIEQINLYAPESEEKNLAIELMMQGKFDMIKTEHLSPLAQTFQKTVITDRGSKLRHEEDPKILKGKTFGPEASVAKGLADAIANKSDAIQMIYDLVAVNKFLNNNK